MEKQQIIGEILNHMKSSGGAISNWYVGISEDARERLFSDHNVSEKDGAWIIRTADGSNEAREIEAYFLTIVGTDGGPGGGDNTTNKVYAYRKTYSTNP